MPFRAAFACLLSLLPGLAGCHSSTRIRLSQDVHTDAEATVLELWVDAPGPLLSDPPNVAYDVCMPLLLYPLDKVLSLIVAVGAPFDADVDLRWGPLGAVAGITLPWVTLIPYIYPPIAPPDVVLEPDEFAALLARIEGGDGVRAYVEIVGDCPWEGGAAALHSVGLLRGERPLMLGRFRDQSSIQVPTKR